MRADAGPVRAIFIISDATGETAERVVRAALRQFDLSLSSPPSRSGDDQVAGMAIDLRVFPNMRHEHDLDTVLAEAKAVGALLVSTLVRAEERALLHQKCEAGGVQCVDLIGSLLGTLSGFFGIEPRGVPGLVHTVSEAYYRRMEAIEFTVQTDDGRDPDSLARADIVLIGVSRTGKTPLSIFLAQKGFRVANVPLVFGVEPPAQLENVEPRRVFGLTIQPDALLQIRRERLMRMNPATPDMSYGQRDYILRDIHAARALYAAHPGWRVIDVTGKAIEETAADIARLLRG